MVIWGLDACIVNVWDCDEGEKEIGEKMEAGMKHWMEFFIFFSSRISVLRLLWTCLFM